MAPLIKFFITVLLIWILSVAIGYAVDPEIGIQIVTYPILLGLIIIVAIAFIKNSAGTTTWVVFLAASAILIFVLQGTLDMFLPTIPVLTDQTQCQSFKAIMQSDTCVDPPGQINDKFQKVYATDDGQKINSDSLFDLLKNDYRQKDPALTGFAGGVRQYISEEFNLQQQLNAAELARQKKAIAEQEAIAKARREQDHVGDDQMRWFFFLRVFIIGLGIIVHAGLSTKVWNPPVYIFTALCSIAVIGVVFFFGWYSIDSSPIKVSSPEGIIGAVSLMLISGVITFLTMLVVWLTSFIPKGGAVELTKNGVLALLSQIVVQVFGNQIVLSAPFILKAVGDTLVAFPALSMSDAAWAVTFGCAFGAAIWSLAQSAIMVFLTGGGK